MIMKKIYAILLVLLTSFSVPSMACTSVIVSGRKTPDGRPLMMKHRDTGNLDNRMEWFEGKKYSFIGLVNSSSKGGEVWSGTNSSGFCIMNTATYDFKDDDVPPALMDKEGILMFEALGSCANLRDFENFLDTLRRPMGVEANFGVIDAEGGAAYYEVNNHTWVKFDVNEIDRGYRVVTNFTAMGRSEDKRGTDRFIRASRIMEAAPLSTDGKLQIDAMWIMNNLSRSGKPIMREITSATLVFSGVRKGEDPQKTVMWSAVGYPETAVTFPLMAFGSDHLPEYVKKTEESDHCLVCDSAMEFKGSDVSGRLARVENEIVSRFSEIYSGWQEERMGKNEFIRKYDAFLEEVYQVYRNDYLKVSK